MTVLKTFAVQCDGCGRVHGAYTSPSKLRQGMALEGWLRRSSYLGARVKVHPPEDLCPDCLEKAKGAPANAAAG